MIKPTYIDLSPAKHTDSTLWYFWSRHVKTTHMRITQESYHYDSLATKSLQCLVLKEPALPTSFPVLNIGTQAPFATCRNVIPGQHGTFFFPTKVWISIFFPEAWNIIQSLALFKIKTKQDWCDGSVGKSLLCKPCDLNLIPRIHPCPLLASVFTTCM